MAGHTLNCPISSCARAGRPVRVHEVELKGGQSPSSVQAALREVLVRATGRHESAAHPVLEPAAGNDLGREASFSSQSWSGPLAAAIDGAARRAPPA